MVGVLVGIRVELYGRVAAEGKDSWAGPSTLGGSGVLVCTMQHLQQVLTCRPKGIDTFQVSWPAFGKWPDTQAGA